MGGKGRCMDNIFVERLWRSLKYEEVYLHAYATVAEARAGIGAWLGFYNEERQHQSLGYRTPRQIYQEGLWGQGISAVAVPGYIIHRDYCCWSLASNSDSLQASVNSVKWSFMQAWKRPPPG